MGNKIVLVDDDRVTLTMLEKILKVNGFEVFTAQDGEEGYELIQKEKPDVLISDMLIPKIHGLDLCQKVKENPELRETKVILMTAVYKGMPFQADIKDCGADDYVEKPVDTQDLVERIEKIIDIAEDEDIKPDTDNNSD